MPGWSKYRTRRLAKKRRLAQSTRANALRFVVLVGVVSLFGDMTYEAARAINGPFLAVLGAGATAVGIISGGGELLGYLVRVVSGTLSGRSGKYWTWTIAGYVINLVAAPALALAGNWHTAAILIISERIGKGIRNPPRDTMLSFAGSVIGQGWAFALREALDQAGAMIGPLAVGTILLVRHNDFHAAYAWLAVPALLSLLVLLASRWLFPQPRSLHQESPEDRAKDNQQNLPAIFWRYLIGMALVAVGYVDFNLISYHLQRAGDPTGVIPLLYTLAMGTAGLSALVVGRWFDRRGMGALVVATGAATLFAPLVFLGNLAAAGVGVALWGIGMGVQDSLMSAPISAMTATAGRSRALGLFNALYGVAWFAGSTVLGIVYSHSVVTVVVISVLAQAGGTVVLHSCRTRRGPSSTDLTPASNGPTRG